MQPCWVKYGQTQQLGCFDPAVGLLPRRIKHVTQPLGQNNPIAGFVHILPSIFLECMLWKI